MWNAKKKFGIDSRALSDVSPKYIIENVKALEERLVVVPGNDRIS